MLPGIQKQKSQSPWNCVSDSEEGHGKDTSMQRLGHISHEQDFKCDEKPLGVLNKGEIQCDLELKRIIYCI